MRTSASDAMDTLDDFFESSSPENDRSPNKGFLRALRFCPRDDILPMAGGQIYSYLFSIRVF